MDLAPQNLLVARGNQIKLIDFGEAYHPVVTRPFVRHYTPDCRYIYSPGRTFPYAPPETSIRNYDLSSQQDVYSLGVLCFRLLTGQLPLTCSPETTEKTYIEGTYMSRVFFAPEQGEYFGSWDLVKILITLSLNMMSFQEKLRPLPIWLHIVLNKIIELMPK